MKLSSLLIVFAATTIGGSRAAPMEALVRRGGGESKPEGRPEWAPPPQGPPPYRGSGLTPREWASRAFEGSSGGSSPVSYVADASNGLRRTASGYSLTEGSESGVHHYGGPVVMSNFISPATLHQFARGRVDLPKQRSMPDLPSAVAHRPLRRQPTEPEDSYKRYHSD